MSNPKLHEFLPTSRAVGPLLLRDGPLHLQDQVVVRQPVHLFHRRLGVRPVLERDEPEPFAQPRLLVLADVDPAGARTHTGV